MLSCGASARPAHTPRNGRGEKSVDLSAREFALAETFLRHPGQVLSREQLLSHVWGYDFDPGSNVVDVYVRYLRRKLGADRFTTLRGMGYRLEEVTLNRVTGRQPRGVARLRRSSRGTAAPATRCGVWDWVVLPPASGQGAPRNHQQRLSESSPQTWRRRGA